jgi:hypothetical protein
MRSLAADAQQISLGRLAVYLRNVRPSPRDTEQRQLSRRQASRGSPKKNAAVEPNCQLHLWQHHPSQLARFVVILMRRLGVLCQGTRPVTLSVPLAIGSRLES